MGGMLGAHCQGPHSDRASVKQSRPIRVGQWWAAGFDTAWWHFTLPFWNDQHFQCL